MATAPRLRGRSTTVGGKIRTVRERHKWRQTEKAVYTQTLQVSNQTEAGRTAVGENEFCSLEAQREKERQIEKEKERKK